MYTYIEARGQHWVSFSIAHYLIIWDGVSHWTWSLLIDLYWLTNNSPRSTGLSLPNAVITSACYLTHLLYIGGRYSTWVLMFAWQVICCNIDLALQTTICFFRSLHNKLCFSEIISKVLREKFTDDIPAWKVQGLGFNLLYQRVRGGQCLLNS